LATSRGLNPKLSNIPNRCFAFSISRRHASRSPLSIVTRRMPLGEAVIDAGAVRFRPMLLTAAAVIVGASVICFDPIFQGLAISLMAGEVASLLLSRMTVPVLVYLLGRRDVRYEKGVL
jgi:Cu/Ag efflux pump CusA